MIYQTSDPSAAMADVSAAAIAALNATVNGHTAAFEALSTTVATNASDVDAAWLILCGMFLSLMKSPCNIS